MPSSAVLSCGNISPVAEDCTNCHNPHGSAQPALLKIRTPFLCQTCHEGAGHPSIVNTPQGLPGGTPSAFLAERRLRELSLPGSRIESSVRPRVDALGSCMNAPSFSAVASSLLGILTAAWP